MPNNIMRHGSDSLSERGTWRVGGALATPRALHETIFHLRFVIQFEPSQKKKQSSRQANGQPIKMVAERKSSVVWLILFFYDKHCPMTLLWLTH